MEPEVSIVIPTRDRPDVVQRAIASALSQEGVSVEVIVVDDGSRHRLPEPRPEQVRVLRHEKSRGVAAARNTGVAEARGEWVAFLDDDDLWAPAKLRRQLAAARSGGADFAYSAGMAIDESGRPLRAHAAPAADGTLHRRLLAANVIPYPSSNVVARTGFIRELGGFDGAYQHLADWDLNVRMSDAGRAAAVQEIHVAYTLHGGNMARNENVIAAELERFAAAHAAARARAGVEIDRAAWLRWRFFVLRAVGDRRGAARAAWALRDPRLIARGGALVLGGERLLAPLSTVRRTQQRRREPPPPAWLRALRP